MPTAMDGSMLQSNNTLESYYLKSHGYRTRFCVYLLICIWLQTKLCEILWGEVRMRYEKGRVYNYNGNSKEVLYDRNMQASMDGGMLKFDYTLYK